MKIVVTTDMLGGAMVRGQWVKDGIDNVVLVNEDGEGLMVSCGHLGEYLPGFRVKPLTAEEVNSILTQAGKK